ncbi:S1 family peptidase [Hyphomonas sp.]|uniref:S1 family peptidase n=1 Tax=Hyphomonas sp. TaxID=87 RepID=UPI00391B7047
MTRLTLLAAASLAVLLAACDQVRLPGQDTLPGQTPAAPKSIADQIAEEPEEDVAAAAASDMEETGEESEWADDLGPDEETPTVDRDAGPPTEAEADAAATLNTAAVAPAGPSALALVNAQHCALPAGSAPTPTVASIAGATQLEEPLAGTEAVGGLAASLSAFPGIVKLEPRRKEASGLYTTGHCSAVRIRENWLLTAAHCVDQPYDELRVIGDAANLRSPAARVTAASTAICHGGYQGTDNGYGNDLALLHLDTEQSAALASVPVVSLAAPALPLAPANYPSGDMAGWGLTRFGGQLSNDLLSTKLKITAVGPATITVASQAGAGPCIGDSGGPLYVTDADGTRRIVGILSVVEQNRATGMFCAGDYNGRYINLQGYTGWIDSVIALCEASPDACR